MVQSLAEEEEPPFIITLFNIALNQIAVPSRNILRPAYPNSMLTPPRNSMQLRSTSSNIPRVKTKARTHAF